MLTTWINRDQILLADLEYEGVHAIQSKLCQLGLLDPIIGGTENQPFGPIAKSDGAAGKETRAALKEFCRLTGNLHLYVDRSISRQQMITLDAVLPGRFLSLNLNPQSNDLYQTRIAKAVIRYMYKKGYHVARSPSARNIIYVEGMNADGTLNEDTLNNWNDRRMVIGFRNYEPVMLVNDQATTEPGKYYTLHPEKLNQIGAARIAFGQYKAWVIGKHQGWQPALVQSGPVRIFRDVNKDGMRGFGGVSDPVFVRSNIGINQHSTSPNKTPMFVNRYSAGCLVGRRYRWHLSFLKIITNDYRYLYHSGYTFMTTVIAGDDLLRHEKI